MEEALDLFAGFVTPIGHRPAAELEAFGRVLGRPAGCLHDAINGNLGANDNLPHRSLSLLTIRRTACFQFDIFRLGALSKEPG